MSRSGITDIDGPIHFVDYGGEGPAMVLVHGLGGSHANWVCVADHLRRTHRVYALDLVGFGVTPPVGRKMSLRTHRDVVALFAAEVAEGEPVTLVGNSMGGLISLMVADHSPELVARLVLINPAVPVPSIAAVDVVTAHRIAVPLLPGVGPRVVAAYNRTTPVARQLHETLEMVCARPERIPTEGVEATMAMMELRREMPWAARALGESGRSLAAALARRRAFHRMVHRIACPTLLVHGDADRVVPVAASERLADERPDWRFHVFSGVGHVPVLEAPEEVAAVVDRFLEPVDSIP